MSTYQSHTTDPIVVDNERFYLKRLIDITEKGRIEQVLVTLGNMEKLHMVTKQFVDYMLDIVIDIATELKNKLD